MVHHPYGTSTFKAEVVHRVSNAQQLKHLLLLYERLMQHYVSIVWL